MDSAREEDGTSRMIIPDHETELHQVSQLQRMKSPANSPIVEEAKFRGIRSNKIGGAGTVNPSLK
jgi:hypothetical protein